jgi:uncharacterized repeat protein (TIGR01451 family)
MRRGRRLCFERLEDRSLLAALDLAAIGGYVFQDADGNGFTPGEQVVGAALDLYRDVNANGVLDAGDGAAIRSATANADGRYRFERLTAGDYFVQQPAQTVGAVSLAQMTSSRITISGADVQGTPGRIIDGFATSQTVTAAMPVGTTNASALAADEALGGERDISATLVAGGIGDSVTLSVGSGILAIDSGFSARGRYQVVWDSVDKNALVLNSTGLRVNGSGVDLTEDGVYSFFELAGAADRPGGTAKVIVYTDAGNYSQATVSLSAGGSESVLLSLASDFAPVGGAGADFTNVGAVELLVETDVIALDVQFTDFRMVGTKTFPAHFSNQPTADLSLAMTTSFPNVDVGQTTSFTLNLLNSGPDTATNVVVTDRLPIGLVFVSATPTQGSYDPATGLWTVGTVPAGTTAIMQVTAIVTGTTAITNTAEVTAADQRDPDSTPNNNNPAEDDEDSVTITPQVADLSLAMTVDNPQVTVGQPVTFTLNVNNAGPATATNVRVTDQLPQGLTFLRATPAGVYNSANGVWTVGTLGNGASASLQITARVESTTPITNTAEVTASDQHDPDSTPGNGIPTEDDQAEADLPPALPPVITVSLDNQTPRTNDVLLATATKSGTEGRSITLTFVWTVNGVERRTYTSDTALTDAFDLGIAGHGNRGDTITVKVTPTDGNSDGAAATAIATVTNSAPLLATIGTKSVDELTSLQFAVSATDADFPGDALIYIAADLPPGATFDPATGVFAWTPTESQQGQYVVTFTATDDGTPRLADSEAVTITVREVNAAPALAPIGGRSVDEHNLLQFTVSAGDPDDVPANSVTLSAEGLPPGATFDPATGVFAWTPTESQQGQYVVTFTATDDGTPRLADSEAVTITVREVNAAPVLAPIGGRSVDEHTLLQFTVSAGDPDDVPANSVTLSAVGLPPGATFDPATGVFAWMPSESQQGQYVVTFTATDDGMPRLSASETVTLTVVDGIIPQPIPPEPVPPDERKVTPPVPPEPSPEPPVVVVPPDSCPVAFVLSGSVGRDWRTEGAIADFAADSPTPETEGSQAAVARLHALTAVAAQGLEPADAALLEIMATDPEPLRLVAFDWGDEIVPSEPKPNPKPEPEPKSEEKESEQQTDTTSASSADQKNRPPWFCLSMLFAAAGAAWYFRKTGRKWLTRFAQPAGLTLLIALCAAWTAGWAGEPQDPAVVIAEARRHLARGEHREAYHKLRAAIDRAERAGAPATRRLGLFDALADVHTASGQHQQALATRLEYQRILASAAFPSDASRARSLQQSQSKLAESQARAGHLDDSERTWRDVLETETQCSPASPLDPARRRFNLAQAIAAGGHAEKAQACHAAAEQAARRVLEAIQRGDVDRIYEAEATLLVADCHGARQRWPDAVAALVGLLARQRADHPARRATLCELARCQHAAGDCAAEQRSLAEALRLVRGSAPDESLETTLRTAEIWDRWGHSALAQGDRPQVSDAWRTSAEAYERALDLTNPPPTYGVRATALRNLREIYHQSGEERKARDTAQKLVDLLGRTRLPDDPEVLTARAALAGLFVKDGRYEDARPYLEAAHAYWEQHPSPPPQEWAEVLNSLGEVERENGNVSAAAELFGRAFQLCRGFLPDRDPLLAEVAVNLGAVAAARGEYTRARNWYDQAIEICGQPAPTPRAAETALAAHLNLAMLHKSQGRMDEAQKCCEKARRECQTLGALHSGAFTCHYTIASLLLAEAESEATESKAGATALTRALEEAEAAQRAVVAQGTLNDYGGQLAYLRGSILFRQGSPEAAAAWNQALQICRVTGQRCLEARILTRMCEAEMTGLAKLSSPKPGDLSEGSSPRQAALRRAEAYANQAISLHRQTNAYPSLRFSALVHGAQIVRVRGESAVDDDWQNASRALLREAVELTAGPRAMTTGAESERAQFFAQYALAFDLLVDWCGRDQKPWEALQYAEASRNRTFLDQVRAAGIDFGESLRGGKNEHLLDQRRNARCRYAAACTRAALATAQTDLRETERLAQHVLDCQDELWELEKEIRDKSPLYREVLSEDEPLPKIEELRRIARPGELILLYHLGARRSHLFMLSGGDESPLALRLATDPDGVGAPGIPPAPLGRETLDAWVQRYLTVLQTPPDVAGESRGPGEQVVTSEKNDMAAQARRLTDILLPPAIRERLTQHPRPQRLIVIPDGALHQLPFEALVWPADDVEPSYVLDHAPPIAYAPSLQIMAVLRKRDTVKAAERSLLTVGMTTFSAHHAAAQTSVLRPPRTAVAGLGASLRPLPATRDECRAAAEACRRADFARINHLLDTEATEHRVRDLLEQTSILHFATHAWVDPQRDNCFGALALTPPGRDGAAKAGDDGLLEHHEIHGLSLTRCELAVLSACRTNIGPNRPLEASSTLTRAFLAAGARRVVCSLWGLHDDAASLFVAEFFGCLETAWKSRQPVGYAAALRDARNCVRRDPRFEAPYYWAPLVLIGPADEIQPQ